MKVQRFTVLAVLSIATICCSSCGVQGELIKLEVTTLPNKTTYNVGESFSTSGMVVTGTYYDSKSDKTSQDVYKNYYYWCGDAEGKLRKGDNSVKITDTNDYNSKIYTTVSITVKNNDPKPTPLPDVGDYYDSISDDLTGNQLLIDLRSLNMSKRKNPVGYDAMGTSPSGKYKYTDYDPTTVEYDSNGQPYGTKILSFYSGTPSTSWNREHVWPNSRGGGSKGSAGTPYVDEDIYMPRPTITSENSDRGNSKYVEGKEDQSKGWDPVTAFGESNCYMGKGIRGECARIIFYCLTVNSKLELDDEESSNNGRNMGKLSDLLRWNLENPVNEREKNRQSGGQYLQGNRNAFVDHPEYACKIWGNTNSTTKQICGM